MVLSHARRDQRWTVSNAPTRRILGRSTDNHVGRSQRPRDHAAVHPRVHVAQVSTAAPTHRKCAPRLTVGFPWITFTLTKRRRGTVRASVEYVMSHNRKGELPERHSRSDRIIFVRGRWVRRDPRAGRRWSVHNQAGGGGRSEPPRPSARQSRRTGGCHRIACQ
jgi:hypothetical protein